MLSQYRHRTYAFSAALLAFLLVLISCSPHPLPPQSIPKRIKPSLSIAEIEKDIHRLINKERSEKGLQPLAWNATLSVIARKHSQDMARRNYFSHHSPEGHDFSFRYGKEDYSCSLRVNDRLSMGGENIFQNNLYDQVVFVNNETRYNWNSAKKIAESTVRGWMNSPGHRKNILTPYWRSEGIGVAISPDDKVYITENFC